MKDFWMELSTVTNPYGGLGTLKGGFKPVVMHGRYDISWVIRNNCTVAVDELNELEFYEVAFNNVSIKKLGSIKVKEVYLDKLIDFIGNDEYEWSDDQRRGIGLFGILEDGREGHLHLIRPRISYRDCSDTIKFEFATSSEGN